MDLDHPPTGADRTGTVAFMATAMLGPEPYTHRPIHDCESVFWLCALDLLYRVALGVTGVFLPQIMNPGNGIFQVMIAKTALVSHLYALREKTRRLQSEVSLNNSKDSLLFFCLTALAREFFNNGYNVDYANAKEGFEDVCFDRCIEIIKRALDPAVQEVTERIAETSLS